MTISAVCAPSVAPGARQAGTGERTVCVVASDLLAADGVLAHLRHVPRLRYLPPEQAGDADVVLIVGNLTASLLRRLESMQGPTVDVRQSVVLITDVVDETLLPQAIDRGVVRIVPRSMATRSAVVHAALAPNSDRVTPMERPPHPVSGLGFEYLDLARDGTGGEGLTQREVAIVRLLALGMSAAEVAKQLSYSERTIKSVVGKLASRLQFRNRNQVIAYAYRIGVM